MKNYVYVAGPFFNKMQSRRVETVCSLLALNDVAYFSPKEAETSKLVQKHGMTDVLAARIFEDNITAMDACTEAIVVLDWVFDAKTDSRPVLAAPLDQPDTSDETLNLPDSGTVWELGYLSRMGRRTVGFVDLCSGNLNLMLAQSCSVLCRGWRQLENYLECYAPYEGGQT